MTTENNLKMTSGTSSTFNNFASHGKLYLVPAPLDFGCDALAPITDVLPLGTLQVAASLQHWVCENAKTTRAVLKRVGDVVPLAAPIQQHCITELPREVHKKGDHVGAQAGLQKSATLAGSKASVPAGAYDARPLLKAALDGHNMGLISEAGLPAVADPGSSVVRAAHALGITVVPLVGPCSLLLALAASGLNGQNFAFVGYLPTDAADRTKRIRELEALAVKTGQSQLFIETPYRNAALWGALLASLQSSTLLTIASGLTLATSQVISKRVVDHKQSATLMFLDAPCVFGLGV